MCAHASQFNARMFGTLDVVLRGNKLAVTTIQNAGRVRPVDRKAELERKNKASAIRPNTYLEPRSCSSLL